MKDIVKKYLPFLWFYPALGIVISYLFVASETSAEYIAGNMMIALGAVAQMTMALVYYKTGKQYRTLLLIVSAAVPALMLLCNIGNAGKNTAALLQLIAMPTVSSAMFMVTIHRRAVKKEAASAPAVVPAAPVAVPVATAPTAAPVVAPVAAAPVTTSAVQPLPVEALKQLKELLDMGALTQDEFDTKKKQLLCL